MVAQDLQQAQQEAQEELGASAKTSNRWSKAIASQEQKGLQEQQEQEVHQEQQQQEQQQQQQPKEQQQEQQQQQEEQQQQQQEEQQQQQQEGQQQQRGEQEESGKQEQQGNVEQETSQCPNNHPMQVTVAFAGKCDGCGGRVRKGQLVMDCRQCNWYVCAQCRPILVCPGDHALRTVKVSEALQGRCDGCERPVQAGSVVTDCRQCNWYLCMACNPVGHCLQGHGLERWVVQGMGKCDGCERVVESGESVMNCSSCDWFLCSGCRAAEKTGARGVADAEPARSPLPKCGKGHVLQPRLGGAGMCDGCCSQVKSGEMVMSCQACNWYLCSACHRIHHCPRGHELSARQAEAGSCDGCGRAVQTNQSVMDCRYCDWYLCGSCHLARK